MSSSSCGSFSPSPPTSPASRLLVANHMATTTTKLTHTGTAARCGPSSPPSPTTTTTTTTIPIYKSVGHVVGYAPEGTTSKCRACNRGFHPGKLRVGTFFQHAEGFVFLRWHHLRCVRPPASLDDVTQLSGHTDLLPLDRERIQDWVEGAEFIPSSPASTSSSMASSSPPLSPRPTLRTSQSYDERRCGGSGSRSRTPSPVFVFPPTQQRQQQERPVLQRALTSSEATIDSSLTLSSGSTVVCKEWEEKEGGGGGRGRRSPLSPRSMQRRIVELDKSNNSSQVMPAAASSSSSFSLSPTRLPRLNLNLGLTINTSSTQQQAAPVSSSSPPASSSSPFLPILSPTAAAAAAASAGLFGTSPLKSGSLLDERLPSPREMNKGKKKKEKGHGKRAKSPLLFSGSRTPPPHAAGAGMGGWEEAAPEERKRREDNERLKAAAKEARHRRRGKTM